MDDEYLAEIDEDNPFEVRMRKIHHLLQSIDRDIIDSDEHFSPLGTVLRMERIQIEIIEEIKKREERRKQRIMERCRLIKEDLMAVCWHPDRVEKWLELGVLDDLD